ncbi:hypothetical protein As57867_004362, partial [Aphanomyces stellatus]
MPSTKTSHHRLYAILAGTYVGLSLAASAWYLQLLDPVFSNDILWTKYAPSRDQALLIDLFNRGLVTLESNASVVPFDLLAPAASMDKTYATDSTTTEVSPTYARRLILAPLSPAYAITNLRRLSPSWIFNMYSQYCWLDFGHVWEMAHTDARQARCSAQYSTNAAVTMESILRNQVWADFDHIYGGPGGAFTIIAQVYLETVVPQGPAWLAATSTALTALTIDQEVAYWQANHATYFQLQWHNQYQVGIADTFQIQSALGLTQDITLKKLAKTDEIWTSTNLFWSEYFDQSLAVIYNQSLIHAAPNYWTKPPNPYDLEGGAGLFDVVSGDYINQARVFRAVIGPFMSVDLFYIQVPVELTQLYTAFQSSLFTALQQDHTGAFDTVTGMTMQPMPAAWHIPNQVFGGGNPMCVFQPATSYVQQLFSFYDACGATVPFRVVLTTYSSVFATVAMGPALNVQSTCALDTTNPNACITYIQTVVRIAAAMGLPTIQPLASSAHTAIASLGISIAQFATTTPQSPLNWTMLTQPLLQDISFATFGWALLYDWIQGDREVVSFQGDAGTLVLVSATQPTLSYPSSTKYIGASIRLIFWLMAYATAILCLIYVVCCIWLVRIRFDLAAINLVWFNHLASSIWVGRPLLYVRGMTAILMLSSSQVNLVTRGARSHFEFGPRRVVETMLVAGEATWIVYVVVDCCTILTGRATRVNAVLSCIFGWLVLVVLECTSPVLPLATFHRVCTPVNMDQAIRCTSGLVQVGRFARILLVGGLLGAAFLLGFLVAQIHSLWSTTSLIATKTPRHLLGVGDVYLTSLDGSSARDAMWTMDKVSCILVGLIPFRWRHRAYIFDVKLWLVHEADASQAASVSFVTTTTTRPQTLPVVPHDKTGGSSPKLQHRILQVLKSTFGIAYVIGSIVGSVSYLQVSQVNLANDILWAQFNMTGAHAFFANWLNQELLLGVQNASLQLTQEAINMDGTFDATNAVVQFAANYGAQMQHTEMATVEATVAGLRVTDPCLVPWIFTQYCFVDFDKRWELANSAARLRRCQQQYMTTNGAVYL